MFIKIWMKQKIKAFKKVSRLAIVHAVPSTLNKKMVTVKAYSVPLKIAIIYSTKLHLIRQMIIYDELRLFPSILIF